MSKIDFGIIFIAKESELDARNLYLDIDSVFFSVDEVIKTGRYKDTNLSDLKMVNVKFETTVNTNAIKLFDTKLFQIINGDYTSNIDEKLESLVNYCTNLDFNKIKIENNFIEHPTNSMNFNGGKTEIIKEYYRTQIYTAMAELEKVLNPNFIDKRIDILDIIEQMECKIKGQDKILESLVPNIVLNQKIVETENIDLIRTQKVNILLDGSTGTGKTLMVNELSSILDIPVVVRSATNYSTVGYVGESLKTVLADLIRKTGGDLSRAKRGIICLDEIDKLGDSTLEIRKGLMQELLTWISGTSVKVNVGKKEYSFDTSLLTFGFLGAFSKIKDNKSSIGFNSTKTVKSNTKDYIEFGMNREFMGRLNLKLVLNDLNKDILLDILLNSNISPLKSFIQIGKLYDVDIDYTEGFINQVVYLALKNDTGARGLLTIMNEVKSKLLIPIMTGELESITLTEDVLSNDFSIELKKPRTLSFN